jgi:hypothetical protein
MAWGLLSCFTEVSYFGFMIHDSGKDVKALRKKCGREISEEDSPTVRVEKGQPGNVATGANGVALR